MSVTAHQVGATCPSCGRFVGPLEQCPHCGAHVKKRLPLRYLRLACLFLALLGVGVLLFAVSGKATPTTKIGSIVATMNYGFVRLEGTVTRGPYYNAGDESLRFYLADETGEIQAWAFRDAARELRAAHKVPAAGDRVVAEGTLRVRDDFSSFNLASASRLEITPPVPSEVEISAIGAGDELDYVLVQGDVRERREPYPGLTLLTIGDASGEIDVAVTGDIETLYGALPPFELGDSLQVRGIVTYFRDTPQLFLRQPSDLERLDVPNTAAVVARISELDAARVGQLVRVSGQVTRADGFSQGMRVSLDDGTGEILLLLWQDVFDHLENAAGLADGAQVLALGRLAEYRGELEIIPTRADDVKISAPLAVANNQATPHPGMTTASAAAPTRRPTRTPTPVPVARTISSLTKADKDARVIVTGAITRVTPFSQGMRYSLDDGTGSIILLIWTDVLNAMSSRDLLVEGAQVRVLGKVDVFNDELEVIPDEADDVNLTRRSPLPTPSSRTIASLSTADLDRTVRIQGTIAGISDFSRGKYVQLRDDSGEILVAVFANILEPIQSKLVAGARVRVQGKVNLFRGELEVIAEGITVP